jgi:phenylpropionate dioxygenase-like ring-hydroxylating dioxygenase large terminal subunit
MKREDNERLCQVGPDTDMGQLLRRYWIPACLSSDLPQPGGAPIRVRLLGENFVVFRGTDGKVGLLDEYCPHRAASLVYARNEESGLRCLFHGWKFASDGRILDTPNVAGSQVKDRLRARAFKVEEASGLVWTYLGPQDRIPERPRYQWENLPVENTLMWPLDLDCNWTQSLEGLVDSAHINYLHADAPGRVQRQAHESNLFAIVQNSIPRLELEATDFGFQYAAVRDDAGAAPGTALARITAYAAPYLCFIPPGGQAFMVIPVDDTHCRFMNIWWSPTERLDSGPAYEHRLRRWGVTPEQLLATGTNPVMPGPTPAPPRNRIPQDRASMEAGTSRNGIGSVTFEDALMSISMGPIADRTKEHLVPTDVAVVQFRRFMLEGARLVREGKDPIGFNARTPSGKISAVSGDIPNGGEWRHLAPPEHVVLERAA